MNQITLAISWSATVISLAALASLVSFADRTSSFSFSSEDKCKTIKLIIEIIRKYFRHASWYFGLIQPPFCAVIIPSPHYWSRNIDGTQNLRDILRCISRVTHCIQTGFRFQVSLKIDWPAHATGICMNSPTVMLSSDGSRDSIASIEPRIIPFQLERSSALRTPNIDGNGFTVHQD